MAITWLSTRPEAPPSAQASSAREISYIVERRPFRAVVTLYAGR
jgi:hypothetical protein